MSQLTFDVSEEDSVYIQKILKRAVKLAAEHGRPIDDHLSLHMDITACHANGCKLDLLKLLCFPDFDFAHDVFGISRHINRTNGKLMNCFLPRCSVQEEVEA